MRHFTRFLRASWDRFWSHTDPLAEKRKQAVLLGNTGVIPSPPYDRGYHHFFVGHADILARLTHFVSAADHIQRRFTTQQRHKGEPQGFAPRNRREQDTRCVLLLGRQGIGKTYMAEETMRKAHQYNLAVLSCRAYRQESDVPYRLWIEVLRKALNQNLWRVQEVARRPLLYQPLQLLLPELQEFLPEEWHFHPAQKDLLIGEAVRVLLDTICERTPLVLILDDLHWSHPNCAQLLLYLIRGMRQKPLFILGTCRDTEVARDHPLHHLLTDTQRDYLVENITIPPLSDEEIGELLHPLPAPFAKGIAARVAGNPFFAKELAQHLPDRVIAENQELPQDSWLFELPTSVQQVFAEWLQPISSSCRHVLDLTSLLGDAWTYQEGVHLVQHIGTEDLDEGELMNILEEAFSHHLL